MVIKNSTCGGSGVRIDGLLASFGYSVDLLYGFEVLLVAPLDFGVVHAYDLAPIIGLVVTPKNLQSLLGATRGNLR
jgi:hypothetical protein